MDAGGREACVNAGERNLDVILSAKGSRWNVPQGGRSSAQLKNGNALEGSPWSRWKVCSDQGQFCKCQHSPP